MTQEEKLELLEEILEADEGTLKVEDRLEDIDEWDSMSKLYLVSYVKKEMNKRLTVDEIKNFKTVQDICDYLDQETGDYSYDTISVEGDK